MNFFRSSRRTSAAIGTLALAASLLTGCVFFRDLLGMGLQQPQVELQQLTITGMSLEAIDLEVGLNIKNANDVDLSLSDLIYQADFNGKKLGFGTYAEPFTAPANGQATITLPIHIRLEEAASLLKEWHARRDTTKLKLRVQGNFKSTIGQIPLTYVDERPLSEIMGLK